MAEKPFDPHAELPEYFDDEEADDYVAEPKTEKEPMTLDELSAIVAQQITNSVGYVGSQVSAERAELFRRYMGEPYGDERNDRSQVVSQDVADTVEWLLPELLEIFTASDEVVRFDPVGKEDVAAAQQETDIVNHIFLQKCNGFLTLYSMFKDALIQKTGVVMIWWEKTEQVREERYCGLDNEGIAKLMADIEASGAKIELVEKEKVGEDVPDPAPEMPPAPPQAQLPPPGLPPGPPGAPGGGPTPPMAPQMPPDAQSGILGALAPIPDPLWDIRIRIREETSGLKVAPIPPEEFLITPRHPSVSLDDVAGVFRRYIRPVSDLVAMGFDQEQVEQFPTASDSELGDEVIVRFEENEPGYDNENSVPAGEAMRTVLVTEAYLRVDFDGDGVAELRRIYVGGNGDEIMRWADGEPANEVIDDVPFAVVTPEIVPHRFFGRSIAERIIDVQKIKTVLMRMGLDNVYALGDAAVEIAEPGIGENTIDDLLNRGPGATIRTKTLGNMREIQPPQMAPSLMPFMEMMDQIRESRTGVSRMSQGIDPDSLAKGAQTATGMGKLMDAAQQQRQLVARIFAETGVKDIFRKMHALLRKHSEKPLALELRGQWIEVDPREWKSRKDMTVSVGLGTGDKMQRAAMLQQILQQQVQAMQMGAPIAGMQQVYNTLSELVKLGGFKNVDQFFTDPSKTTAQTPGPPKDPMASDPQAMALVQAAQITAQQKQQQAELQNQLDIAKLQQQGALDEKKLMLEMQLKQMDIQGRLDIEREKAGLQLVSSQITQHRDHQHDILKAAVSAPPPIQPGGMPNGL